MLDMHVEILCMLNMHVEILCMLKMHVEFYVGWICHMHVEIIVSNMHMIDSDRFDAWFKLHRWPKQSKLCCFLFLPSHANQVRSKREGSVPDKRRPQYNDENICSRYK